MEISDHNKRVIIIDNGSGYIKSGINNNDNNDNSLNKINKIPTVVGHPKFKSIMASMGKKSYYIGSEVYEKCNRGLLDNQNPISNGLITNWDDIEKIWEYTLSSLSSSSTNDPILVTETSNNSKANRDKIAEIMFEKFNVPSLCIVNQALLSFYSSSSTVDGNGIVIECGDGLTQVVPIYQGKPIKESSFCVNNLSGNDITKHIANVLNEYHLDFETIRNVKETIGSIDTNVSNNNNKNNNNNSDNSTSTYKLLDGKTIDIKTSLINNCIEESLFKPNDSDGIHQVINNSILKSLEMGNDDLHKNIIFSGGTTMFTGFKERLYNELQQHQHQELNIIAPDNRNNSVFKGACMFSSLSNFDSMCISRDEYNESLIKK